MQLHLVTDRKRAGGALVERVEAALRGGVDAVQLREKDLPARVLQQLAHELLRLCRRHGARLLINDRIDVALAVDADGVHLPATSFRVAEARALLGTDRLIGVSTHDPDEVAAAAREGADYAVFGPVFETPSKAAFGPPQGVDRLRRAVAAAAIPVLAIGGITPARVREVRDSGAAGVAAISSILAAADPAAAARSLRW